MNVYADLKLYGDRQQLLQAVADIEAALADGWTRSRELEGRIKAGPDVRCFVCTENANRRPASLWFGEGRDHTSWSVNNIVPTTAARLSEGQYNAILEDFRARFVEPVAARLGLRVEMGKTAEGLEDWMSDEAADKLRNFSAAANKSTGSAHPLDKERWFGFLVAVHESGKAPDASTLQRWLTEEDDWPQEIAAELAIEFENGLALLKYYDAL